jgi:hypothetical protein
MDCGNHWGQCALIQREIDNAEVDLKCWAMGG